MTIRTDGLGSHYTKLGFVNGQVHGIGHGKVPEGADSVDHARGLIRGFQLDNVAKIAAKLAKIPEGDGTACSTTRPSSTSPMWATSIMLPTASGLTSCLATWAANSIRPVTTSSTHIKDTLATTQSPAGG